MEAVVNPAKLRLLLKCILLALAGTMSYVTALATHLRAGEITVERVNCSSNQFRITVTVYTNTGSPVRFGGDGEFIDFGDGNKYLVPETENTPRPDLGENIGTAGITVIHTFAGPGRYVISWREPNRNDGVLNMNNSVNTQFYIETEINIDPFYGCDDSPVLQVPPIDRGCTGVRFEHNAGAYDPDGDSISYELVTPYSDRGHPVTGYADPTDPKFYAGLNYDGANEAGTGRPTFSIDPVTGTIVWDAPGAAGEYNIAFIIREWRKGLDGKWQPLGFVRRDMQIIIEDCTNNHPELVVPNDTCVVAGTHLDATIFGTDPDGDSVQIVAFSEVIQNLHAQFSPVPGADDWQPSNPPAELHFSWDVKCEHVKDQPYQVVFKIIDNPNDGQKATGPKLTSYKTWQIRVVGPSPIWNDASVNLAQRHANLKWEPYFCENATVIQVWRKVGGINFVPGNCETGMPNYLGYTKIADVPAHDNGGNPVVAFTDTNGGKGLAVGASYCYRLVAIFPAPAGGASYVSRDTCLAPILADAPVITNVTVDTTDFSDGEITVSWRSPFDIDAAQYPGPYTYKVLRANGFAGNNNLAVASGTGELSDTTFTDTGLDTEGLIYNYRIVLYSNTSQDPTTWSPIDTSSVASSVRLEAKSETNRIDLSWSAFVPWSNQSGSFPYHLVYRGPEHSTEADLVFLDSVNVLNSGFAYSDQGLNINQEYCYRVVTQGTYGNPAIAEPIINYSQIVCALPSDTIPPCVPEPHVQLHSCEEFLAQSNCNQTAFSNTIYWNRPGNEDCRADLRAYNIYASSSPDGTFFVIASDWRDTVFVDTNLSSFARCYSVTSVDRSGNESAKSDPVCGDNCPYYELPNVFTPNGDGCNDFFSAFSTRDQGGGEESKCPVIIDNGIVRCARFVESVAFKVYNRWGKEVYSYQSGGEQTIYVDWDGRDSSGSDLASGIYYYTADVTFDMADPNKRQQTFKGWVHLIR